MVNTPGLGHGLKIEVEFTLAAPLDGTDAVMPDRHCYFGYGAEASEEFLLDSALGTGSARSCGSRPRPMRTRRSGSCGKNLPTLTTQRRAHNPECGGRLRPPAIANDLLVDGVAVCEQGSP